MRRLSNKQSPLRKWTPGTLPSAPIAAAPLVSSSSSASARPSARAPSAAASRRGRPAEPSVPVSRTSRSRPVRSPAAREMRRSGVRAPSSSEAIASSACAAALLHSRLRAYRSTSVSAALAQETLGAEQSFRGLRSCQRSRWDRMGAPSICEVAAARPLEGVLRQRATPGIGIRRNHLLHHTQGFVIAAGK